MAGTNAGARPLPRLPSFLCASANAPPRNGACGVDNAAFFGELAVAGGALMGSMDGDKEESSTATAPLPAGVEGVDGRGDCPLALLNVGDDEIVGVGGRTMLPDRSVVLVVPCPGKLPPPGLATRNGTTGSFEVVPPLPLLLLPPPLPKMLPCLLSALSVTDDSRACSARSPARRDSSSACCCWLCNAVCCSKRCRC